MTQLRPEPEEREQDRKTVSASTARPRGVWIAAAGILVLGLLFMNSGWIGRVAMDGYDALQARRAADARQAARSARAVDIASVVEPSTSAEGPPPPTVPASTTRPPAAVTPAAVTASAATPAPQPAAAAPSAPPPLARLYVAPPAGQAGLVMLLRSGALRPASGADLAYWKMRYESNNPGGLGRRFDEWTRTMPAYVILDDMSIPEGLSGANAVIFLLGDRAPFPTGDPGHSVVLDPASGTCVGTVCRMLMRE